MSRPTERQSREPLQSVLVATDFSLGGIQAVKRAAQLPLAPGARVVLQHVAPAPSEATHGRVVAALAAGRLDEVTRLFTDAARAAGNERIGVTTRLDRGAPFAEIVRQSRRLGVDLIVLGRHGQRALRALLIGTTAQRVVRKSSIPVLVVNSDPAGPYLRPLFTTDLGESSLGVAKCGSRLIDRSIRSSVLVHAYFPPHEGVLYPRQPGRRDRQRVARAEAVASTRRMASRLAASGLHLTPRALEGDPRPVILEEASRRRTDLIVVGSHGRSGLVRTLLGSVAEGIATTAKCDVLVARPPGVSVKLP